MNGQGAGFDANGNPLVTVGNMKVGAGGNIANCYVSAVNLLYSAVNTSYFISDLYHYGQDHTDKGNPTNSCILLFGPDTNNTWRMHSVLERRPEFIQIPGKGRQFNKYFYVWNAPGGGIERKDGNDRFTAWRAAIREYVEEVHTSKASFPAAHSGNNYSFEFAKFTIDNTRFYCWMTNDIFAYYKGKTESKNNETIFADFIRVSSIVAGILDAEKEIEVNPRAKDGSSLAHLLPDSGKFKLRRIFRETFTKTKGLMNLSRVGSK